MTQSRSNNTALLAEQHHLGRGITLILGTTVCFATLDTLSKLMNKFLPVNEIIWGRYFFHGLVLTLLIGPRMKLDLIRTAHPRTQILRGLILLASSGLFTTSLLFLPIAEAAALSFMSPLLLTALSVPMLGERVRRSQWLAVATGFAGVLVIVRPGGQLFEAATLLPIGCAITYALFQIITRKYAGRDSAYTTHFWTALVCTVILSFTLPFFWKTPEWWGWLALLAMGIVGGGGHYLLIRAYENAPPATLAPFSYAQLVWAGFISWLVFDHIPDAGSLLGMTIIGGSGLFAIWMQRRKMRANEEGIATD
ncbi:MAG: DMT family transporter [Casimicrobiaceae bacterium]